MAVAVKEKEPLPGMDVFTAAKWWGLKFGKRVLPKDKNLVIDGFRLHYLDWGSRGKPPMLLLHGGGQTAHTWDFFALCLRNEYHVYALDQRGHGDSEWSPAGDYSSEAHQRDIEGVVDALKLDKFILIGLSMGGNNAYTYAAKNWKKLAGLVIVDVGPEIVLAGRRNIQNFVSAPAEEDNIEAYVERAVKFNPRRPPEMLRRSLLHSLRQLPSGKWTWKGDRRRSAGLADSPEEIERRWNLIKSIRCPTLVVRGAESDVFEEKTGRRMQQLIPGSQFVTVSKAGHTVMGDNPPEFEAKVRAWLATLRKK